MNGNLAYKLEAREEIIGGEVVMMSAPALRHFFIAGNLHSIFDRYLHGKPCTPIQDGAALYLEEGMEEYQPDMMVVCDPSKLGDDGVHGAPDLVVEVLSPSTGRYDRGRKRDVYEQHGVREYWIVDPELRTVEQYVLENGRFDLRDIYYQHYPDYILKHMKEEERAAIPTAFRCTLFDDLEIRLEDVFYRLPPVE